MADSPPLTVEDLAEEAGLPLPCLENVFHEEYAPLLAEYCDPWEPIGYHLKLTKVDINTIKNDNETTELKRIATLETWYEKFAHKATYRVLIEALIRSKHAKKALCVCRTLKYDVKTVSASIDHSESDDKSIKPSDPSLLSTLTERKIIDCHDAPSDVDVAQSIRQLQKRFICIQNRFLQSGTGTGVTLEQLQTCLSTLPSFTTDAPQLLLEATSIKLFNFNLKQYCCALNPDILEGLIEVLGDVETNGMINQYNRDLNDFQCKTKLKDFIGNYDGPTPPEYKDVQLKLGDNWREKTLADVRLLNSQISRQSWLLKMVSIGSIHVTFMIPQMDDLELGVHLRDYLQTQCVLQILVCGVCIFNCEGSSSYISEQQLIIAPRPDQLTSMLQSATADLLQVFMTNRLETNGKKIEGHISSKLNDFKDALLSKSVAYPPSEVEKLSSFKGAQLKFETLHLDPTTSTDIHSKVIAGLSTSSTEKGRRCKTPSLESAQHRQKPPVGMKRSRSNLDSVGQPTPKLARKGSIQTLITEYSSTIAVGGETVQPSTSTSEDDNMISGNKQVSDNNPPSTLLNTPSTSTSTSPRNASSRTKLLNPVLSLDRVNISKSHGGASTKPKQQSLQKKLIRRTRCSDNEKHLCPVCSVPDCGKCKNCLNKDRYHKACIKKPIEKCRKYIGGSINVHEMLTHFIPKHSQEQSTSTMLSQPMQVSSEQSPTDTPSLQSENDNITSAAESYDPCDDFLDKALKDSYVEIGAAKCGVFGPPGTGKSHFKALISGRKKPEGGRQSTAIADEADQITPVVDIASDFDDEVLEMHTIVAQSRDGSKIKWYVTDSKKLDLLVAKTLYKQKKPNSTIVIHERQISNKSLRNRVLNHLKKLIQKNPKVSKLKCLNGMRLIYIVDTGGQPQFQEIMPMFVRSSSVHFLVHKLNEPLDECPQFDYEIGGIKYTVPEKMQVSNRAYIEQSLRTISSCVFARSSERYISGSIPKPQFAVIGMFKDKCSDIAALDKKQKDVNDCIQPYITSKKCEAFTPSRHIAKPIFSIDGSEEGWSSNGNVIDDLHTNIENFTTNLKVEIPTRWFLFLNLLKEQSKHRLFLTLQECKDLAKAENIMMNDEEDIIEALQLLDELNLVLYFHKFLPSVVFISPAFLLNKVSEIIVQSFDCDSPNTGISNEERQRFRKTGIFEQSMLQKVKSLQQGFDKHFSQDNFLDLLKQLCIIADIKGNRRFFIPCVLALERIDDGTNSSFLQSVIDHMHTAMVEPLVISFPDGYSPRGLFCASVAFLAKLQNWAIESSSSPESLTRKRNLVEFEISECTQHGQKAVAVVPLGKVVILDRISQIEVYSTCNKKYFCDIRRTINEALWYAAAKCLAYNPGNISVCIGFSCQIDCGKPKPHGTAVQDKDDPNWSMKCIKNSNKRAVRLNDQQLPWFTTDSDSANTSNTLADSKPTLALLMDEVAEKTNKWEMIALHLDIEQVFVERIDRQERGDIQACFHAVFAKWQKQLKPPFTWSVIIDALNCPSVAEVTVADDLRKKYLP